MSIEDDLIKGNTDNILSKIDDIDNNEVGVLFLYSVIFEHEDIALYLLENKGEYIEDKILCESFESAAAHNEYKLVQKILELYSSNISEDQLIDALRISAAKSYINILQVIATDKRVASIINIEDEGHPHILIYAIDKGDYNFVEKLLDLPEIKINFKYCAYASRRDQHKISELLKIHLSKQQFLEDYSQSVLRYEKDHCMIGPHLQAELAKRNRILQRGRLK